MIHNYQKTPLEQWIEELYLRIDITQPFQLNIMELSRRLNVWVYFLDMGSEGYDRGGLYSININRNLSPKEQWEDFLHELCHVLRHSGDQTNMPPGLFAWQEMEADSFHLYAAMPYFMIKNLELPSMQSEAIEYLSFHFDVTPQLAKRRIEQIQRRILQGVMDKETNQLIQNQYRKYNPANWSDQTKEIMDKLKLKRSCK